MGGWALVALPQSQLQLCLAVGLTAVFLLLLRPRCPRLRRGKINTKDMGAAGDGAELDAEACCSRAAQGEGPAAEELQPLRPRPAAADPAGRPGQAAADPGAIKPVPPSGPRGYQRVATADEVATWGAPEGSCVPGAAQGSEPVARVDRAPASTVAGPLGEDAPILHPAGQASSAQPAQPDAGGEGPGSQGEGLAVGRPGPAAASEGPGCRAVPAPGGGAGRAASGASGVACRVTGASAACSAPAGEASDAPAGGTVPGEVPCRAPSGGQAAGALGCDLDRRAGPRQGEVTPVDGATCAPGQDPAGVDIRVAPSDAGDADEPAAQVASTRKVVAYAAVFATLSGAQLLVRSLNAWCGSARRPCEEDNHGRSTGPSVGKSSLCGSMINRIHTPKRGVVVWTDLQELCNISLDEALMLLSGHMQG